MCVYIIFLYIYIYIYIRIDTQKYRDIILYYIYTYQHIDHFIHITFHFTIYVIPALHRPPEVLRASRPRSSTTCWRLCCCSGCRRSFPSVGRRRTSASWQCPKDDWMVIHVLRKCPQCIAILDMELWSFCSCLYRW